MAGLLSALPGAPGPAVADPVRSAPFGTRAAEPAQQPAPAAAVTWRPLLEKLLARRSRAYATGELSRLGTVHQPGSPVLAADRAMLRAWLRRDLTVTSTVRLIRVRLVARGHGRAVLRTVDVLHRAVAVGADGSRLRLPHDQPTARRVVLVRTDRGWRIGAVQALTG
ncbi:hypothetical protein BH20ACT6_BH20ACT6_18740 [soil metagenome]